MNNFFFLILFFDARLFADGTLQIIFAALALLGWWSWLHIRTDSEHKTTPVTSRWDLVPITIAGVVVATAVLTLVLRAADDSAPFLDALTTSISLGAIALMNLKILESWYFWIVADLIYIPLYFSRDLVLTAIVYCVFLVLCFRGFIAWKTARELEVGKPLTESAAAPRTV